ncbi:MAG: hypothetical protein KDE27_02265 [Planctomycetes bacterium]|nr:hypothetical protein [Planctomycetota bacterium]
MFSKQEFQDWVGENAVPFAAVMTKIEGRKDDDLLRTYEFRGFPSMAILDAGGEAITKKVPRDLFSMQNIVAAATVYPKLKATLDAGEPVDEKAWLMAQLRMGDLSAEDAAAEIEAVGLTGEDKALAARLLLVLQTSELWHKATARDSSDADRKAAREQVWADFKAGKRLPAGTSPESFVDGVVIDMAKETNDKEAFFFAYERVAAGLKERLAQLEGLVPRYRTMIDEAGDDEKKLELAKRSQERLDGAIEIVERELAELDAFAAKLRG